MFEKDSYFPIFLTLKNKKVLLLGAGKVATHKLSKLLDFTKDITIVAKDFSQDILELIKKHSLNSYKKEYEDSDLDGYEIVIVAVDDIKLQKRVYFASRDKRVFVNSVDVKEYCDFIFGSYIKKDELVLSISTSGTAPSIAKYLKIFLEKTLPKNLSIFLKDMKKLRDNLPKGKERMKLLDKRAKEYFDLF
jgi:precorrin-2 dehydrogenase/sirohydrochlorin ferrochelatase